MFSVYLIVNLLLIFQNDELPNPPAYIFMIEVSSATFRNGLIQLLCENMKNVLQCLKK